MDLPEPDLTITSPQNPRIKSVLRLLRQRRARDREGTIVIEGVRELTMAMAGKQPCRTVYFCPEFIPSSAPAYLLTDLKRHGADFVLVPPAVFQRLSYREHPEGILATGPWRSADLSTLTHSTNPALVVAQGLEKPGNLGALLRTADGAGLDGVIVCDRTTDIANPNTVRASLGTLFSIPVAEAPTEAVLDHLDQHGIAPIVTTPAAGTPYWEADLTGPAAIVVGPEHAGLSERWLHARNAIPVAIPMHGRADSLNASVAAAILMYELVRQRSRQAPRQPAGNRR